MSDRAVATAEAQAARASGGEASFPRKVLHDRDVLALTVGIVVGAGIFRTPSVIAGMAGTETIMLAAWVAGGLLSIVGALCYAELASAYPHVGGDYYFLRRAYGLRTAFLYGWARFSVIQTGSIALLAFVFGDYAAALLPIGPYSPAIYAALAVIAVSMTNWLGVRVGAGAQAWLTVAEVLGLIGVIVAGLIVLPEAGPQSVPGGEGAHERLEILDGGPQPKVRIGSTCGGGQPELAGTGRFDVELDLPAAAGPRICEITIATNFRVTLPERAEADSVRLEVLAWSPAADEATR